MSGHDVVVQVAQVHTGVGAEQRWKRQSGCRWGQRQLGVGREVEGRSYHDITPLLCCYISEQHSFSTMLEAVRGGWSGGRGGVWGIGVLEVEFLYSSWGIDIHMREPHVI